MRIENNISYKEYITKEDVKSVLNINNSNFFTYFNKRSSDIVETHYYNIILYDNNKLISYGHLDLDKTNKLWLGILVSEEYRGLGFGRKTMNFLINKFILSPHLCLNLSVSKENVKAQKMYELFNFKFVKEECNNKFYVLKKD